jgi:RimJ/RimL family protein N-acetyltransferase/aryl carrier-like protein
MTIELDLAGNGAKAASRRDRWRHELAELLDLAPDALGDSARLAEDLGLDSLAMMSLLTWMDTRGVAIGSHAGRPATVGEALSLIEQATVPGLSIRVSGGQEIGLRGLAEIPPPTQPGSPLAPVLDTPAFRLTPVEPGDLDFLYALAAHPETGFRWRYRGAPPPPERFAAELWTQVLVQYIARQAEDGQPAGHVVAYGADPNRRHAYLGAVFAAQHTGAGLAAQVVAVFARYLFHTFPLRKLYLEVPGYNWPQLRSGEGRLFGVEGVLRDHDYYAGRHWDQRICAIYPDHVGARPQ